VYPATVAEAVIEDPVMLAAVPVAIPTPVLIIALADEAALPVAAAALDEAIMLAIELDIPPAIELPDMAPTAAGYWTAGPEPQVLLGAIGHVTFWQMDS